MAEENSLTKYLSFPVNREGWLFIALFAVVAWVLGQIWGLLGLLGFFATLWSVWFFRDPERVAPARDGVVVSPADGVVKTVETAAPPAELGLGDKPRVRITLLRTLLNVHVNRVPVEGKVVKTVEVAGSFADASRPAAAAENERLGLVVAAAGNRPVAVVQVAGPVVRHLSNDLVEGQPVKAGQRAGISRLSLDPVKDLIKKFKGEAATATNEEKASFSLGHLVTRVDVYLPEGVAATVAAGQSIIAGETVLAELA
ncbi:MAG: Phosphatidylserine decarboxylase [Pseudomonadota bacterium]|jgi:phosphatidylserine decarboxylase